MSLFPMIPRFAFGTAFDIGKDGMTENDFVLLLLRALELGVRHIDCAPLYATQQLVGQAIKMTEPALKRSDLFITSKLPVNMMRKENIRRSLNQTLGELQVSYLDLFLIHAPFATKHVADNNFYPTDDKGNLLLDESPGLLESAWEELYILKQEGLVKYIGVSNVNEEQLMRLRSRHKVDVLQNEMHLYHQDKEMRDRCKIDCDTHYVAYAALGSPKFAKLQNKLASIDNTVVERIARKNNLTRAQVIIQWLNQEPLSYVIRSDNIDQLEENVKALGPTTLSISKLKELDELDREERLFFYTNHKGIERHMEYPFDLDD